MLLRRRAKRRVGRKEGARRTDKSISLIK